MIELKISFNTLRKKYQAIITSLVPRKMWEISIPALERTTYAQTGLILKKGPKFDTLTDNGTTNNGNAFSHPGEISRQLHQQMIKYNMDVSGNEFYTCQFPGDNAKLLVQRIQDMINFLTSLDQIMKQHL